LSELPSGRTVIAEMVKLALSALLGVTVAACGGSPTEKTAAGPSVAVSPSSAGKHERVDVAFTTRHSTGVVGKTRRSYSVEGHAVQPAMACMNDGFQRLPDRPRGTRVRAVLDPTRGKGHVQGWCPGAFRGTVTYSEAFACPAKGTCHPPRDFPTRTQVVARFRFRVR
jgi:hypothetical protein